MYALITLVVLVAGFLFTSSNPITRFTQYRSSGWNLYCHLFIWGVWFAFLGLLTFSFTKRVLFIQENLYLHSLLDTINDSVSIFNLSILSSDIIAWMFFTITEAYFFGKLASIVPYVKEIAVRRSCKANDLKNKFYESSNKRKLVQITLNTRKVYIGLIIRNNDESANKDKEYIELVPYRSGYRDDKTLKIAITNDYSKVYYDYMMENKLFVFKRAKGIYNKTLMQRFGFWYKYSKLYQVAGMKLRVFMSRFSVVIPFDDIVSVSYFDVSFYSQINGNVESKTSNLDIFAPYRVS